MSSGSYTVLCIPVFLGFASLAVDHGWMRSSQGRAHNAADAAALAGVAHLDDGEDAVDAAAIAFGAANGINGEGAEISADEVEIGTYLNGVWTTDADGGHVRVVARGRDLPTFFGVILGDSLFDVAALSIAGTIEEEVTVTEETMAADWPCGIFARNHLDMNGGGTVDGYASTEGAYDVGTAVAAQSASICSNGSLQIGNNSDLYGTPHPGPDDQVTDNSMNDYLNGHESVFNDGSDYESLLEQVEFAEVAEPENPTQTYASGEGAYKVNNSAGLYLASGVYYFPDGLHVTGQGHITLEEGATVTIVVKGPLTLNGQGIVNTSQDPHALDIQVMPADGHDESTETETVYEVILNGGSDFYGTVYAPHVDVRINGGNATYGAIVGEDVALIGTGDIHVDTSLVDDMGTGAGSRTTTTTTTTTRSIAVLAY